MKTETIRAIGLELADIRKSKNLTLQDVCAVTGVNRDTICKYENGNSSMKVYILDKLLTFYNINIANFFTRVYARMQNNVLASELEE